MISFFHFIAFLRIFDIAVQPFFYAHLCDLCASAFGFSSIVRHIQAPIGKIPDGKYRPDLQRDSSTAWR